VNAAGLTRVQVEAHAQNWWGIAGLSAHRSNIEQLQDRVAEAGRITDAELEPFYELIDDPSSRSTRTCSSRRADDAPGVTTAGPS
jgi:hypothetical protein